MSLDSISPLASDSLRGVGLDTGVWVCVMLAVKKTTCQNLLPRINSN